MEGSSVWSRQRRCNSEDMKCAFSPTSNWLSATACAISSFSILTTDGGKAAMVWKSIAPISAEYHLLSG